YTERDRLLLAKAFVDPRRRVMVAAMDKDFRAAGRPDVCAKSPGTKFDLILGIPHPEFDKVIRTSNLNSCANGSAGKTSISPSARARPTPRPSMMRRNA